MDDTSYIDPTESKKVQARLPHPQLTTHLKNKGEEVERGRELEQGKRNTPHELPPAKVSQYVRDRVCILDLFTLLLLLLHLDLRGHFNYRAICIIIICGRLLILLLLRLILIIRSSPPFLRGVINTVLIPLHVQERIGILCGRLNICVKVARAEREEIRHIVWLLHHGINHNLHN